ncbi:ribosome recycling factor [soil metagenome]
MLDPLLEATLDDARESMQRSLEHLSVELSHIRAGRASPAMVEDAKVEAYGSYMPLNQVASVSAPQPDMIIIQPWDKSMLGPIERAIQSANLGFNPSNDGSLIRISVPPPTEERRIELAKTARARGEDARVALRNVRRSAKDQIKKLQQDEKLSEDMRFEAEAQLQTLTDQFSENVESMITKKERDIMVV